MTAFWTCLVMGFGLLAVFMHLGWYKTKGIPTRPNKTLYTCTGITQLLLAGAAGAYASKISGYVNVIFGADGVVVLLVFYIGGIRNRRAEERLKPLNKPTPPPVAEPISIHLSEQNNRWNKKAIELSDKERRRGNYPRQLHQVFLGKVDEIRSGIAYVSLRDELERVSHGEINAADLEWHGIRDRDRFLFQIVCFGPDDWDMEFTRIERRQLTEADLTRIQNTLDLTFPSELLNNVKED